MQTARDRLLVLFLTQCVVYLELLIAKDYNPVEAQTALADLAHLAFSPETHTLVRSASFMLVLRNVDDIKIAIAETTEYIDMLTARTSPLPIPLEEGNTEHAGPEGKEANPPPRGRL